MSAPTGILFVCLGNICRSPLAQGVFAQLAKDRGVAARFRVASAGTGHWHLGEAPDPRSSDVARRHGIVLASRAQIVNPARHFSPPDGFDWLIGMDRDNCARLLALGAPCERVRLLRSFDPALTGEPEHRLDVPDPYYGGEGGFDEVFEMVRSACAGMLDHFGGATQPR